jgi:outer membrane protein OmpA-like peptidoglycan-associated protein
MFVGVRMFFSVISSTSVSGAARSGARRVQRRSAPLALPGFALVLGIGVLGLGFAARGVPRQMQSDIEAAAARVLAQSEASWASVKVQEERLLVTGVAPDVEARSRLLRALTAVQCSTFAGNVRCPVTLEDRLELAPPPPPPSSYPVRIIKRAAGSQVVARVPDAELATWLQDNARQALGVGALEPRAPGSVSQAAVQVQSEVVAGRPFAPLQPAVSSLLRIAAELQQGRVELDGLTLSVDGVAVDANARERAQRALSEVPAPFTAGHFNVLREDELRECERSIGEIVERTPIKFVLFGSQLKHSSKVGLTRLAGRLRTCAGRVLIEGHSDNIGEPENNLRLSQERAEVVLGILAEEGLPRERLKAVGLGETRPIAGNQTRAGRSINRRIELHLERPTPGVEE